MIITSLLDTDFYKFTMMQVVLHQFPDAMVAYQFKCRTAGVDLLPYAEEIRDEINKLGTLRFTAEELDYLRQFSFFKVDFIEFLRIFELNPKDFVMINTNNNTFELIVKGPWLHTILFEIPILAIIGEVYFRNTVPEPNYETGIKRLADNIMCVKERVKDGNFSLSDYGTRRRFSKSWQALVIATLQKEIPSYFVGTSNVWYAKQFGVKPLGTMAHEYVQACQALGPRVLHSQQFAFEKWAHEYRGELGIALSDTIGIEAFFRDFDLYFCKLFDGIRQDSGDPYVWAKRIIEHYKKNRIDPKTKTIIFSDCLTFEKALDLYDKFHDQINIAFGIGTHLTNDLGYKALQNVIKMTYCNDQPVAKLSDSPEKTMCPDISYLNYLKKVFDMN